MGSIGQSSTNIRHNRYIDLHTISTFHIGRFIKYYQDNRDEIYRKDHEILYEAGIILCSIIIIIDFTTMILNIDNTLSAFFNPEYWALHKILALIK